MFYVLDERGRPQHTEDSNEWAEWRARAVADGRMRVALTEFVGGDELSTVFLGYDHGYGRHSPPLLYETMLLVQGEGQLVERTSSRAKAQHLHNTTVEALLMGGRHLTTEAVQEELRKVKPKNRKHKSRIRI